MENDLQDISAYLQTDGDISTVDHCAMLADITGTHADEWGDAEGPDTRCGVDYYYYHQTLGLDARINNDQGMLSICVTDEEGDEVAASSIEMP